MFILFCQNWLTYLCWYFQTDTLSHYSSYSEADLLPTMQKLASLVIKADDPKLKLTVSK